MGFVCFFLILAAVLCEQFFAEGNFYAGMMKETIIAMAVFFFSFALLIPRFDLRITVPIVSLAAVIFSVLYPDYLILCPAVCAVPCFKPDVCGETKRFSLPAVVSLLTASVTAQLVRTVYRFRLGGRIEASGIAYNQRFALAAILLFGIFYVVCALLFSPARSGQKKTKTKKRKKIAPPMRFIFLLCALSVFAAFIYCLNYCGMYFIKVVIFAWGTVTLFLVGSRRTSDFFRGTAVKH